MATTPTPMTEQDHEDDRWVNSPTYDPQAALTECLDLWASGAWPDDNAVYNLAEVMEHLGRLLAMTAKK